jgi:F-type H+-transporting ATPase subunit gamma
MTRLADIEGHIGSMSELLDIVGAMRSLASMRVQEAHRAVPGVRRYAQSMADAIGDALGLMTDRRDGKRGVQNPRALILFTAEHGFVGGFNERLLDAIAHDLRERDLLFVLGSRGALLARERGHRPAWDHHMATRLASVPETVRRLTAELYQTISQAQATRAEVVFARYRQGSTATVERRLLFPLDLETFTAKTARLPPLHNLPPAALLEQLVAEYVSALLIEAAIESFASENAARFSAMEAAHDNVSKKLDRLRDEARQARQDEITTELIDLVTGAEALRLGTAAVF